MKKILLSVLSALAIQASYAQIPTNGLVAKYSFNTSTPIDGVLPYAHGINSGNATQKAADRSGNPGAAATFNGSNSFVYLGTPQKALVSNGLTISAWVNIPNTSGQKAIVSKWANSMNDDQYILMVDGNRFRFAVGKSNTTANGIQNTTPIVANTWYHVVATWNTTGLHSFYVNGVLDGSVVVPGFTSINNTSATTLAIGAQIATVNNRFFDGRIDDVLLYDRDLSLSEIQNIYNTPVSINDGLVSKYTFTGNMRDEQNDNHATAIGASLANDRFGNASMALNVNTGITHLNLHDSYDGFASGGNGKISYSFWVNFKNLTSSYQMLIAKSADGGCAQDDRQFLLRINPQNKLEITAYATSTAGNYGSLIGSTTLSASQWYHVVMCYDAIVTTNGGIDKFKLYLNNSQEILSVGTVVGSGVGTGYADANACIGIGAYLKSDSTFCANVQRLDAYFDDLHIYNKALNTTEINNLYTEGDPMAVGIASYKKESDFKAFPNPFTNTITLKTETNDNQFVEISSVDGKILFAQTTNENEIIINTENWSNGIYFVSINNSKGKTVKKLIKY